MPLPPQNYDLAITIYKKNLSQKIYKFLADDVMLIHNKYMKWRDELGNDFCESLIDFGKQHLNIFKVTNVPKYRSFQYRLLQRGIVTNIQLHKWKMISTDLCSFCNDNRETVIHMLVECSVIQQIWQKVYQYCFDVYATKVDINARAIIMNKIHPVAGHVTNFICLIAKQYIYRQRCLGKSIKFVELKALIESIQNVEKYIAIKNDNLSKHNRKWKIVDSGSHQFDSENFVNQYLCTKV